MGKLVDVNYEALFSRLREVVGPHHVITDPDQLASFATDWTRRFTGSPRAVVRPATTAEVASVLQLLMAAGIAVVPQGGNTGLVGGSICEGEAVVVSTSRLNGIGDVDTAAMQVSVGAGVTLAALHAHVGSVGLRFPVDLGARSSATIGGMVATNAGGTSVIRFGMMRAQLLGVEAVLTNGLVVSRMSGLVKDNTGYDFAALLAGSEGTLAVITQVRVRLVPANETMISVAISIPSLAAGLRIVRSLQSNGVTVDAAEFVRHQGLDMMSAHLGRPIPREFGAPAEKVLLLNLAVPAEGEPATETIPTAVEVALAGAAGVLQKEFDHTTDIIVATSPREQTSLWEWRERHTEALSALGIPLKLDVSLPPDQLDGFESEIDALVADACPTATVHVFGHIADGNLHVNVLGGDDEHQLEQLILGDVVRRGGSVSAEHGIGRAKRHWLRTQRGDADVEAMQLLKRSWDPTNRMNPGVLFPAEP
jgi:FAD/FMN-containing dehydrogenase